MRLLVLLAALSAGCINYVDLECPSCRVLNARARDGHPPMLPRLRPSTKRVFLIIPGALGYGWEWTPAVKRLAAQPDTEFFVLWWEPLGSVRRASREVAHWINDLLAPIEPRRLEEVVIVAHSMAGLVAAQAAPALVPLPEVRMRLVTIGTAFAGMIGPEFGYPDDKNYMALFANFSAWLHYPSPPAWLDVVEYRTTWPEDPVMEPRFGHDPAPPDIGPQPRRRVQLPHMDHSKCVDLVVDRLLRHVD